MDLTCYDKKTILEDEVFLKIFEEENELSRARMTNEFAERAKQLGVKQAFDRLLQAYKKENRRGSGTFGHVTEFASEYPDMKCGEWIANENGIFCLTMFGQEQWACTHPILPIRTLINVQTRQVKTVLAYKLRGVWEEAVVDRSMLASNSRIVQLADKGIRVTSENSRALVRYLADIEGMNEDRIPEQMSTSKLGWTKSGFMPYDTDIIFDSEDSVYSIFEAVREKGRYRKWVEYMKHLRQKRSMELQLYLAGSFASPLLEKLNIQPFIIDLYGETGNGKTVALMAALSVWADPEIGKYLVKADSTNVSLEALLDLLNNLPAAVDDFSQLQRKLQGDFSSYVYMLCSGMGRLRSNVKLGLQRTRTWKNIILTNSERSLVTDTMQGGAINRIIEYESLDIIFDKEEGNRTVSFLRNNYGHAGREYINTLEAMGFDKVRELQSAYAVEIRREMERRGIEKEEKQIAPMSVLLTADRIATDYIFMDGVYMDFDACFDILKSHEEVSENERAYAHIVDDIQVHANNFKTVDNRGEIWGEFKRNGTYAAILGTAFSRLCEAAGTSPASFKKWAAGKGLIETDSSGKLSVLQRINGKAIRCIMLRLENDNGEMENRDGFVKVDNQMELPFK